MTQPVRPRTTGLLLTSLVAVATLHFASAVRADGSPPATPSHFYYFDERVELSLDTARLGVRFAQDRAPAPDSRPAATSAGGALTDLESLPVPGWAVRELTQAAPAPADLYATMAALDAEPAVEFVSPVFYRASGRRMLVTPDILLRFQPEVVNPADLLAELAPGLEIVAADWAGMAGAYHLRTGLRNGFDVLALANRLAEDPRIEWAEPDAIGEVDYELTPNDPYYTSGNLWGLNNYGQFGGVPDMDMDAPEAWNATVGSSTVKILALDSGVQQNHPDINQLPGEDFTSEGGDGGPQHASENHGTTTAGCVSAIINNGLGVVGIAPGCKVISGRFSIENTFSTTWLVNAINWGVSQGARCSYSSFSMDPSSSVTTAYNTARTNGMVHFGSSGNDGVATIGYPASLASVNAVGGITRSGSRYGNYGTGLDFTGPAVDIYTTDRTGSDGYAGGDYVESSGTSYSCPYAAGVAALLISQNPSLTVTQVESKMQANAKDLGAAGYDTQFGWGLINANNFDCNNNGIPDADDISSGSSADCQPDGVPDECQISGNDCNANSVPDDCEIDALIIDDPDSIGVCPGGTAQFTVSASQSPVSYQWKKDGGNLSNGGDISGATSATLSIANVDAADAGGYTCAVTYGCLTATSTSATLTVLITASIASHPTTRLNKCEGADASFSVTAGGSAPFTYLWYENGAEISGATSSTLTISAVTLAQDEFAYTCRVTNACGTALSNPGVLNVVYINFTDQPDDVCGATGSTVTTSTDALSGGGAIIWQWWKGGVLLSGQSTKTLTLNNVQSTDEASYQARAIITSPTFCAEYSNPAIVLVGNCCATPGDLDGDGDFDLLDMSEFTLCFGPGGGLVPGCECANVKLDLPRDVDLQDWSAMEALLNGPLP